MLLLSKRHAYKPDVGGNFLRLTWFNHLIDGSIESRGQAAGLFLQILAYRRGRGSCLVEGVAAVTEGTFCGVFNI